jgi:hypothetical protein
MRDADFGPWQHHGNQVLPPKGVHIGQAVMFHQLVPRLGSALFVGPVTQLCDWSAVIRYRVRRPAGLALLEAIARDPAPLPAADREGVQA